MFMVGVGPTYMIQIAAYARLWQTTPGYGPHGRVSAGMLVVVYTDNMSSASSLRSGRTKDSALAACSRQLWLEAALADHDIEIRHKPGVDIPLADALSRYHDPPKKAYADAQIALRRLVKREPALPHPFFTNI